MNIAQLDTKRQQKSKLITKVNRISGSADMDINFGCLLIQRRTVHTELMDRLQQFWEQNLVVAVQCPEYGDFEKVKKRALHTKIFLPIIKD